MRLCETEIHAIKATAAKWFGAECLVRVFGSRADDASRGGDIDLHVITNEQEHAHLASELGFIVDLKNQIGDQHIDVIVRASNEDDRPIDVIAKEKGILL